MLLIEEGAALIFDIVIFNAEIQRCISRCNLLLQIVFHFPVLVLWFAWVEGAVGWDPPSTSGTPRSCAPLWTAELPLGRDVLW